MWPNMQPPSFLPEIAMYVNVVPQDIVIVRSKKKTQSAGSCAAAGLWFPVLLHCCGFCGILLNIAAAFIWEVGGVLRMVAGLCIRELVYGDSFSIEPNSEAGSCSYPWVLCFGSNVWSKILRIGLSLHQRICGGRSLRGMS
ncbi:hypothetical protein Acr_16g0008950 [Actinidia rufa]|uniref:Uncharacterized protein n=1 Tax=Actinidia rufa TaxID=165716 RepID=A0A7J0FZZ4_9ERIC|nr:hypothetical protein Acr_16g0008950 [Actinidia rufa]